MLDDLELTSSDVRGKTVLSRRGLRSLQQHGLQGPRRAVRADDHEQRPARHDHGATPRPTSCATLASKHGMVSLRDAGIKGCFEGITTLDEVVRETILEA